VTSAGRVRQGARPSIGKNRQIVNPGRWLPTGAGRVAETHHVKQICMPQRLRRSGTGRLHPIAPGQSSASPTRLRALTSTRS